MFKYSIMTMKRSVQCTAEPLVVGARPRAIILFEATIGNIIDIS
jgi:hypothetical protein